MTLWGIKSKNLVLMNHFYKTNFNKSYKHHRTRHRCSALSTRNTLILITVSLIICSQMKILRVSRSSVWNLKTRFLSHLETLVLRRSTQRWRKSRIKVSLILILPLLEVMIYSAASASRTPMKMTRKMMTTSDSAGERLNEVSLILLKINF